jgi:hypothetical protein
MHVVDNIVINIVGIQESRRSMNIQNYGFTICSPQKCIIHMKIIEVHVLYHDIAVTHVHGVTFLHGSWGLGFTRGRSCPHLMLHTAALTHQACQDHDIINPGSQQLHELGDLKLALASPNHISFSQIFPMHF